MPWVFINLEIFPNEINALGAEFDFVIKKMPWVLFGKLVLIPGDIWIWSDG